MKELHYNQGFSLIELMVVMAIASILASIAIPAYTDYLDRAKIMEGISLAGGAKVGVSDYYITMSSWPTSNSQAGLADTISSTYVSGVTVGSSGVITIDYLESGISGIDSSTDSITLTPGSANGSITWSCSGKSGDAVPNTLLPVNCR